jgi:hypothetical protein
MLIDYLEEAAADLKRKKEEYQRLNREYHKFYSKDLRDEMDALRGEIKTKSREVTEQVFDNLRELLLIKRYFPELYGILLEDEGIGALIKKKDWLLDRKEEKKESAEKKMKEVRAGRAQLREARKFLEKWPRQNIDAKSITATWPVLKDILSGEPDKEDALGAIEKKERELIREGWKILLNESMMQKPLDRLMDRIKSLKAEEDKRRAEAAGAKGKGSVKEYETQKALEKALKERERMERVARHLILSSPAYLEKLKKPSPQMKKTRTSLDRLTEGIKKRSINETAWLKDMKKRLGLPE